MTSKASFTDDEWDTRAPRADGGGDGDHDR